MKILLVTDTPWARNEATAALSELGTEVHHHDDPRTVTAIASDLQPDVVIVDLQVGSMGGMAVVRAIRDAEFAGTLAPTTVVLLLDRNADQFLARRSAADGWVVKPFTPQQLRAAIAVRGLAEGSRQ